MKLVLDASVAVKLVLPEEGQENAFAVLRQDAERIAPEFLLVEAGNTLWKKVSRGEVTPTQAAAGIHLISDSVARFVSDAELTSDALALAVELGHPLYDCLYVALAQREDATVITDDARLLRKLQTTRLADRARPLRASN